MTDPQSYISSGILELYVSGQLSESEADEVRRMADKHPEVQAEIISIEEAVAALAQGYKRKPKRDLLAGVLDAIEEQEEEASPIIQLGSDTQEDNKGNFRWLAIAAAIAFLVSLAVNIMQYQEIQEANLEITKLDVEKDVLISQIQKSSEQISILTSANFQSIELTGQDRSPNSKARVFYNSDKGEIFLSSGNLSVSDQEKQFQLWAIIDGRPVDAGVFNPEQGLLAIKSLKGNIQAFAITLEDKGGNPVPNMEELFVIGKVS